MHALPERVIMPPLGKGGKKNGGLHRCLKRSPFPLSLSLSLSLSLTLSLSFTLSLRRLLFDEFGTDMTKREYIPLLLHGSLVVYVFGRMMSV